MHRADEFYAKAAEGYRNQNIMYGLGATYLAWGKARARTGEVEGAKVAFAEAEPILRKIEAIQLLDEMRTELAKLA